MDMNGILLSCQGIKLQSLRQTFFCLSKIVLLKFGQTVVGISHFCTFSEQTRNCFSTDSRGTFEW